MSIAPGIPLELVKPNTELTSTTTLPAESLTRPPLSSTLDPATPVPAASHIAASPAALAAHQLSTSAVLSTLQSCPHALPAPTDVEDLVLLDGTPRRRPPVIPAYCPYRVHLQAGRPYRWCACGRSQRQPFCDDSHRPGDPQPLSFVVAVEQRFYYLCGCKYSGAPPFCDGSHIHAVLGAEEQRARREGVRGDEAVAAAPPTE